MNDLRRGVTVPWQFDRGDAGVTHLGQRGQGGFQVQFALAELQVLSNGTNIA